MTGQITDADVYLAGNELIGKAKSCKFNGLKPKTIEHETLGSVGILGLPTRGLEIITGELVWDYLDPDHQAMLYDFRTAQELQLHQALDVFGPDGFDEERSTTMVSVAKVLFTEGPPIGGKKNEMEDVTTPFTAMTFLQRDIKGSVPFVDIDLFAKKHNVNGVPLWRR